MVKQLNLKSRKFPGPEIYLSMIMTQFMTWNCYLNSLPFVIAALLPSLAPVLNKYRMFDILPEESVEYFADIVRRAINLRKESEDSQGVRMKWAVVM